MNEHVPTAAAFSSRDAQDALRARVNAVMQAERLSQKQIAAECDVGYTTFAAWLTGKYTGDNADKAASVARWLDHREKRRDVREALPAEPGFRETASAKRNFALFRYCQAAPDVGVVAGGAGIGKTVSAEAYRSRSPNVFIVTCQPVMRSPFRFVAEVASTLTLGGARSNSTKIAGAIVERLSNCGALLIVDEAQHLGPEALDQARSFHDLAKCGLVFLGNQSVYSRMGDGRAEFAQIFSRIGMKITQPKPRDEDIDELITAWRLPFETRLARQIAKKHGALRGMSKALRVAHMIAAGRGEPIAEEHLKEAWEQIGFDIRIDG